MQKRHSTYDYGLPTRRGMSDFFFYFGWLEGKKLLFLARDATSWKRAKYRVSTAHNYDDLKLQERAGSFG